MATIYIGRPNNRLLLLRKTMERTILQTTSGLTMPLDVMNKLRFEVAGNHLYGYMNGQLVVTATDSAIVSGSAGIITKDLVLPNGLIIVLSLNGCIAQKCIIGEAVVLSLIHVSCDKSHRFLKTGQAYEQIQRNGRLIY